MTLTEIKTIANKAFDAYDYAFFHLHACGVGEFAGWYDSLVRIYLPDAFNSLFQCDDMPSGEFAELNNKLWKLQKDLAQLKKIAGRFFGDSSLEMRIAEKRQQRESENV